MMMDRILLGVLYLSGWLIFSTCVFHQYHFVPDPKNWIDARTYCRQTYTDLATIENTEEMNQLINTVSFFGYSSVWIGVYFDIYWCWGHSITANYWNWENQTENEPFLVYYFCGTITVSSVQYAKCSVKNPFICDFGTQQVFVNETMDWFSAWRYCTENFTQLTTTFSSNYTMSLVPRSKEAWFDWIGHPKIYWSDGSGSSFRNWDNFPKLYYYIARMCGVVDLQRSGKWQLMPCTTKLPFVCYNISEVPVHQKNITVLKVRMNSSVDLNDSTVKAGILKTLQDRLEEKGVGVVALKWREQPDGKVFHKEGETNVTHVNVTNY